MKFSPPRAASILTLLFFIAAPAFADLSDNMNLAADLIKAITAQAKDKSKNAKSVVDAGKLVQAFAACEADIPGSASGSARKADYQGLIQREVEDAKKLQRAFQDNDNAAAIVILKDMQQIKSDGHDKYKKK